MTLKGGCRHRSNLKDVVSNHLYVGNVKDVLLDFFNSIGLSESKKTLSLLSDHAVKEKRAQGWSWSVSGRKWGHLQDLPTVEKDNMEHLSVAICLVRELIKRRDAT
jgi:hypothetical protein